MTTTFSVYYIFTNLFNDLPEKIFQTLNIKFIRKLKPVKNITNIYNLCWVHVDVTIQGLKIFFEFFTAFTLVKIEMMNANVGVLTKDFI